MGVRRNRIVNGKSSQSENKEYNREKGVSQHRVSRERIIGMKVGYEKVMNNA